MIATVATLPSGETWIGTGRGLYSCAPGDTAWKPAHVRAGLQILSFVTVGDTLWVSSQDQSTGGTQLHRLGDGQLTTYPVAVQRSLRHRTHEDVATFTVRGGLCIVPGPREEPYILQLPDSVSVNEVALADDGTVWVDAQTEWLRFESDRLPPDTRCEAQATLAAGDALIVRVTVDEWFRPADRAKPYSVSTRLDDEEWSPFLPLQDGTIRIEDLAPGLHRLAIRARDEGLDVDPTPAELEFRVVRPGLPVEALLSAGLLLLVTAGIWVSRTRRQKAWLESFRRLLGKSGAAVLTVDRDSVIIEASSAAGTLLGIEPKHLGTLRLVEAFDDLDHGRQVWTKLLSRGTIEGVECRMRSTGGRQLTTVMSAVQTAGPRHTPRGFRVLFHDITAARAVEQQLRQAQKMEGVGQLAGGIAHDFNNLLCGMIGYADLIRAATEGGRDTELHDYARLIVSTGRSAADLTRQLLTFSRQGVLDPVPTDVHEIFAEVHKLLAHTIDRRIEVRLEETASESTVRCDRSQVNSAILNLAINARDAMPQGGVLTLGSTVARLRGDEPELIGPGIEPGDYVCIRVSDTGDGIAQEDVGLIFEPFFTTKDVGKGTGLGLAAVYGTIVAHRGAITVDSRPGSGTTMRLFLPIDHERATASSTPPAEEHEPKSTTILVVDDEAPLRNMMAQVLIGAGVRGAQRGGRPRRGRSLPIAPR